MTCPANETLQRLLDAKDVDVRFADLVRHLDTCVFCRKKASKWGRENRIGEILLEYQTLIRGGDTKAYGDGLRPRIGQYELESPIGRGGSGEVFKARHMHMNRIVAIKVLAARFAGDELARRRFFREMESIGQLDNPHIVRAYDAGSVDGALYLAMEFVQGEDVESYARRSRRLAFTEACEIVRQTALGLQHIHERGLIHRDLKPSNLLLSKGGIKIADLGLALLNRYDSTDDRLTGEHVVLGTVDYMSPEQTDGSREADIRGDLYSLGCTLFRLLAGRPPYATAVKMTPSDKMQAHRTGPIPDLLKHCPEAPLELREIVQKLLAKDPNDRFAQPKDLAEAIAPFCTPLVYPKSGYEFETAPTGEFPLSTLSNSASDLKKTSLLQTTLQAVNSGWKRYVVGAMCVVLLASLLGLQTRGKAANNAALVKDLQTQVPPVVPVPLTEPVPAPILEQARQPEPIPPNEPATVGSVAADPISPTESMVIPPLLPPITTLKPITTFDPITTNEWKQTFGAVPREMTWPDRGGVAAWQLSDRLRAMAVETQDCLRMVKLGDLSPDKTDFTLRLDVEPRTHWTECGVFLGAKSAGNQAGELPAFQAIQIKISMAKSEPDRTCIRICRFFMTIRLQDKKPNITNMCFADAYIAEPMGNLKLNLQISVHNNSIQLIRVGGQHYDGVYTDLVNSWYSNSDYQGGFGVFVRDGFARFSNPHFERQP